MNDAQASNPNYIKAGSLRAGFYFAHCFIATLTVPVVHAAAEDHASQSDASEQRLYIGADPRLELLTVVQLLSRYPYLTPYRVDYARDAIAHFSSHQRHQAITLFQNLSSGVGWSDAYPTAMLYLSDPPALETNGPIPPHIYRAFRGPENFTRFIQVLRDFARQTHFNRFFARQEKLYIRLKAELSQDLSHRDPTAAVEAYYGTRQLSYHLVLSPLLHHGGFGPHLGRPGGPYDVYTLLGPTGAERGVPKYGPRDQLLQIIWHEFSHAYVNPLSEDHYDELMHHAELFTPLAEQMNAIGYTRWLDCANEHLIRAITARLAHHHLGPEAGRQTLREESARGFRYIHALAHRLEEYEARRDDYPIFASFFPQLIAVFAELQSAHPNRDTAPLTH